MLVDLPGLPDSETPPLLSDQSLRGHALTAEDFPRHYPQLDLFGFRRYERVFTGRLLAQRAVLATRQGISLELLLRPISSARSSTGGPVISAGLPTSP